MAKIQSFEKVRLSAAEKIIAAYEDSCKSPSTFRLEILEQLAARTSGISEDDYRNITGFARVNEITKSMVDDVEVAIGQAGIPLSVALSSLSRVELDDIEIKKNGSVYTDFRLAKYLAKSVMQNYSVGKIIDPACGSSIVLAAIAEEYSNLKDDVEDFVSNSLFGVDLSIEAIRGSLLSLSTFLSNPEQLDLSKILSFDSASVERCRTVSTPKITFASLKAVQCRNSIFIATEMRKINL